VVLYRGEDMNKIKVTIHFHDLDEFSRYWFGAQARRDDRGWFCIGVKV